MIPVLTCDSATTVKQSCSCANSSGSGYQCNCTRAENGIESKGDVYESNECLDPYRNGNYQCCVPKTTVDRQIPTKQCLPINAHMGQNLTNQLCKCQNLTVSTINTTTNLTTRSIVFNCQCRNSEYLTTTSYNFSSLDRCLNYNASVSDCCITDAEREQQIPQLTCPSTTFMNSTSCMCDSIIVNG